MEHLKRIRCIDCLNDPDIICPRDADIKCLICHGKYCGGHIAKHLKEEHYVSLELEYCKKA